jgi:hypothetical protein
MTYFCGPLDGKVRHTPSLYIIEYTEHGDVNSAILVNHRQPSVSVEIVAHMPKASESPPALLLA